MKKLSCMIFVLFLNGFISAQKMDKKQAQLLFDKTLVYLKVSDEVSFINMWNLKTKDSLNRQVAFDKQEIREHFAELKVFLDTAITQNLKIVELQVEKLSKLEMGEYSSKYKIKAWFSYSKKYRKGFGFYVDCVDNKWYYRFAPDYSVEIQSK